MIFAAVEILLIENIRWQKQRHSIFLQVCLEALAHIYFSISNKFQKEQFSSIKV